MKKLYTKIALGGGSDSTTTTQEPPDFLKPYLTMAAAEAQRQFQGPNINLPPEQSGIAPLNANQLAAQEMALSYASGGQPVNMPQYQAPVFTAMGAAPGAPAGLPTPGLSASDKTRQAKLAPLGN